MVLMEYWISVEFNRWLVTSFSGDIFPLYQIFCVIVFKMFRKYPSGHEKCNKKKKEDQFIQSQKGALDKFFVIVPQSSENPINSELKENNDNVGGDNVNVDDDNVDEINDNVNVDEY